jgi:site-specific DNA-methyltransferase (adenine-specific)
MKLGNGTFWFGDCFEVMPKLVGASIDMILCDLPYGTTACKWDTILPFEELWTQYKRITKANAAIVLTASQPFTSALVMSNPKIFRHEWVWKKDKSGNIATLKYQPAKVHESVLIFGFESPRYIPQMELRPECNKRNNAPRTNRVGVQGDKSFLVERSRGADNEKYPISVKEYNCVRGGFHPTQKPVALFEYLIKTYTNEGDLVLDNCAGSGTTAIACENTNRRWICIEKDKAYFDKAVERVEQHLEPKSRGFF